jgi:hypothetical protein
MSASYRCESFQRPISSRPGCHSLLSAISGANSMYSAILCRAISAFSAVTVARCLGEAIADNVCQLRPAPHSSAFKQHAPTGVRPHFGDVGSFPILLAVPVGFGVYRAGINGEPVEHAGLCIGLRWRCCRAPGKQQRCCDYNKKFEEHDAAAIVLKHRPAPGTRHNPECHLIQGPGPYPQRLDRVPYVQSVPKCLCITVQHDLGAARVSRWGHLPYRVATLSCLFATRNPAPTIRSFAGGAAIDPYFCWR